MPKASEIARELRAFADHLDKSGDVELIRPDLSFYHGYAATKEQFLHASSVFPRPFKKSDGWDHKQIRLTHETESLRIEASIEKDKVCTLIAPARPAVFECEPLLSQLEEESIR